LLLSAGSSDKIVEHQIFNFDFISARATNILASIPFCGHGKFIFKPPPPGVVESKIVNDKIIKESEFPTVDKEMPRNSQQNQQIHSFF
jgi:hypothetical protein